MDLDYGRPPALRIYFAALTAIAAAALLMLSAIMAINALARLVYHVFVYGNLILDLPPRLLGPAPGYLQAFALFGAFAILSGVVWWYLRRVVEHDAGQAEHAARSASPRRIYDYVVAALAIALFGATAPGLLHILGASLVDGRIYTEAIVVQAILVVVGLSAWAFDWRAISRRLSTDDRRSSSRRVYLYLVITAGAAAVLSLTLSIGVLIVLQVLSVPTSVNWADLWWVPTAVVAAVLAISHWRILQADRAALAVRSSPA